MPELGPYHLIPVLNISDDKWKKIKEICRKAKFPDEYRSVIETVINEYVIERVNQSSMAPPAKVREVLKKFKENSLNIRLDIENILLRKERSEKSLRLVESLINEFRQSPARAKEVAQEKRAVIETEIARIKENYRSVESIEELGAICAVEELWVRSIKAQNLTIFEDIISKIDVFLDLINRCPSMITEGDGNPGDPELTTMLFKLSIIFERAGGGKGYTQEFLDFWHKLKQLIARHFESFADFPSRDAVLSLTDPALVARLKRARAEVKSGERVLWDF